LIRNNKVRLPAFNAQNKPAYISESERQYRYNDQGSKLQEIEKQRKERRLRSLRNLQKKENISTNL